MYLSKVGRPRFGTNFWLGRVVGLASVLIWSLGACKKERVQPPAEGNSPGVTLTLRADTTTIRVGGEAVITATTSLANPTFSWRVNTSSAILGSGAQVRLHAHCPSCVGQNVVTCQVREGDRYATAQIVITVVP